MRSLPARFDASDLVVEQFWASSKDGTRIPYFIVRRRDLKFDGTAPTLLYAYGGFQVSQTPSYSGTIGKLWLEKGGVYVVANIRGGGEFGPRWHNAGLKLNRMRVYDDFFAVSEDLIRRKITSPRRLGIMGGSNGGLLMGVALTKRPELYNAIVIQVPLFDMIAYDHIGAGASWIGEYGDPKVPAERAVLMSYSPYQNLKSGQKYPKVFIETSTKDDRVHPAHARKAAARLKEYGYDFLYYENIDGGHAAAANLNERALRTALEFTYLQQRLMDQGAAPGGSSFSNGDRAEIQSLSEKYLRALNACAAEDYAALFAPGAYFFSTFRGRIEGREKLIELVRSERHCQPGAAPRQGGTAAPVTIEPTASGAHGLAILANNTGAYDDTYVKTAQGWRFASRNVLTPQELAAKSGTAK